MGVLSSTTKASIERSEREIEADVNKEESLFRRIQALYRFLAEHLHKEELSLAEKRREGREGGGGGGTQAAPLPPSPLPPCTLASRIFGFDVSVHNTCAQDHLGVKSRLSFQTSLQFPKGMDPQKTSFEALLERALTQESTMRAWCPQCKVREEAEGKAREGKGMPALSPSPSLSPSLSLLPFHMTG